MTTAKGIVSRINKETRPDGTHLSFWINAADGTNTKVDILSTPELPNVHDGDTVEASGEINSEDELVATTLRKLDQPKPQPKRWKLYAVGLVIILALVGLILWLTRNKAQGAIDVAVINCGRPVSEAPVVVTGAANPDAPIASGVTQSNGHFVASRLAAGTYNILVGTQKRSASTNGKSETQGTVLDLTFPGELCSHPLINTPIIRYNQLMVMRNNTLQAPAQPNH